MCSWQNTFESPEPSAVRASPKPRPSTQCQTQPQTSQVVHIHRWASHSGYVWCPSARLCLHTSLIAWYIFYTRTCHFGGVYTGISVRKMHNAKRRRDGASVIVYVCVCVWMHRLIRTKTAPETNGIRRTTSNRLHSLTHSVHVTGNAFMCGSCPVLYFVDVFVSRDKSNAYKWLNPPPLRIQ